MDTLYLDQDIQERALHELSGLKQKNKPFADHLAHVQRLLLEAGG